MSATQDFVALDWIKGEIASTLDQAQQALEAVAESPDDSSSMRACLTHLHQVNGTLRMVNLEGPLQLATEMEELAESLMGNEVPDLSRAQEVLMQAILQMPRYLDRIQREQKDEPAMVRPVVNSLRLARGEASLGGGGEESDVAEVGGDRLSPLTQAPNPEAVENYNAQNGPATARKLRGRYQQGLSALLKKQNPRENLTLLGKVFTMLLRICGDSPMGNLSLLGLATIEGVATGGIKLNAAIANNLKAFDAELKKLVAGGADGLSEGVDVQLGEQLLVAIDGATKETQRINAAKARFTPIAPLVPDDEQQQVSFGPDDETLAAVSRILIEELAGITDRLDLYVRSADRKTSNLVDLIPQLEQISGTLSVIGLTQHLDPVANQIKTIRGLQESGETPSEDALLDIARSLLEIESSLKSLVGDEEEGEGEGFGRVSTAEATVLKETRTGLASCKDTVVAYVAADYDKAKVEGLPERLVALRGGLQIINQMRSAEVLAACAAYVRVRLIGGSESPSFDDMNDLADAITSIDYYLERYLESPGDPYLQMIEVAEQSITKLGFEPGQPGRGADAGTDRRSKLGGAGRRRVRRIG
ncbi:MAG: Hpt domain-containing protein [Gammaproteobacteria bacterium]|nr:Hpt domain-containing protein [Gammaproteobacteria bacterium]